MASDGGYQTFSYELYQVKENHTIEIAFKLKPIIKEINIDFLDRQFVGDSGQLTTLKEGDFFEDNKLKASLDNMRERLEGMGFPNSKTTATVIDNGQEVVINEVVTLGKPRIFKNIKTNATSTVVNDHLVKKFQNLYNKPFEFTKFKTYLDEAQKELFSYGYYLINLDFSPKVKGNRVTLDIKVNNDKLFVFDFKGVALEDRVVLQPIVTDLFRKYKKTLTQSVLKQGLTEHYRKQAHLNPSYQIEVDKFRNKFKENVHLYRITINQNSKTKLEVVNYIGNSYYSNAKLKGMFEKEAFELASINYYDEEFLNYFNGYIKSRYIKNGFVQARVQGPNTTFNADKTSASVDYVIQEGLRAFVRSVEYEGMPPEFENAIRGRMSNQVGKPFNPLSLVEDIKLVANILQENGYYYAEVTNANDDSVVKYSKSGSDVDIKLVINPGSIVRLNRVLILGNNKTIKKVILKKVTISKDDLITPGQTRDIEASLSATGLFNTVNVSPVKHNSKNPTTDLIIKVSEREYGLVEFAPGYRTDLGIKLTGTVSYLNIGGKNKAITLRGQINQRLNYQTFDPRRRKERRQVIEYNTSVTYTQGDIYDTLIDYSLGVSNQRRRFYSFDADIQRINNTITRDFSKTFSMSLRHQYENISQSDATEERDNVTLRIGAITPSLTWDLRNSQINPVKGAFFNLSTEFANPYFLSQKESDLTIDYYKLISRNRFYLPFKNGTVALSIVGGVQENLAKELIRDGNGQPRVISNGDGQTIKQTKGYIPNIKVFRLTGMDIVRGYDDEEINRLIDGRDISEARVQDRAYLANIKLEPRYFINDTLMTGVFFDAGRVYVDRVDLGELRQSVGLTFKVITPVGTLDFDYGIKLLRKKDQNGNLEDPGRFHVSIGFF